MSAEPKFWRLLGDYERLTQEESTALRELNFSVLREIQDRKQTFLRELVEVGGQCGLNRQHPEVARRLTLLAEARQRNVAFITNFLASRRSELNALKQAFGRVRPLRSAYGSVGGRREACDNNLFA